MVDSWCGQDMFQFPSSYFLVADRAPCADIRRARKKAPQLPRATSDGSAIRPLRDNGVVGRRLERGLDCLSRAWTISGAIPFAVFVSRTRRPVVRCSGRTVPLLPVRAAYSATRAQR